MPLDTNMHSQQSEHLHANPFLTKPASDFPPFTQASRFSRNCWLAAPWSTGLYTVFQNNMEQFWNEKKNRMKEWEINGENAGSAMQKLSNASERIKQEHFK